MNCIRKTDEVSVHFDRIHATIEILEKSWSVEVVVFKANERIRKLWKS